MLFRVGERLVYSRHVVGLEEVQIIALRVVAEVRIRTEDNRELFVVYLFKFEVVPFALFGRCGRRCPELRHDTVLACRSKSRRRGDVDKSVRLGRGDAVNAVLVGPDDFPAVRNGHSRQRFVAAIDYARQRRAFRTFDFFDFIAVSAGNGGCRYG